MKRFTAILLSLIMAFSLSACGVNTDKNGDSQKFTEPIEVTAPDGRPVYDEAPFIEYPQTGEYKETALLTNVPGQGVPLLLDMREDGTIDYIFSSTEAYTFGTNSQQLSFKENGVKYYTIAPDGTTTLHDESWVTEIDNYVEMTTTAANIKNGRWIFHFAAEKGTILILGQFGPNYYGINEMLVTVLFKIQNDQVTIVPIDYGVELNGQPVDWSRAYITDLRLENGYVFFENRSNDLPLIKRDDFAYAAYQLNGTLTDIVLWKYENQGYWGEATGSGLTTTVFSVNSEGKVCLNEVYWPAPFHFTEDDSLYNLGLYPDSYMMRSNIGMTTYENPGEDFCCWFDEAGQGVLVRYDYNPEGAIDPDVVTVWSLKRNDTITAAVAKWNHTHASPIFRYETAEEELEGTNLTEEDILTRLNLELLNGQGPDVMVLDGLNVENYIEFMTPLDRLNTEGVYQNILDRFTVNGNLLAIPTRTVPYLVGRLAEGTQKIESLEQFADIITAAGVLNVRDADDFAPHPAAQYFIKNYNQLFRLWYPAWADAMWEDGKLNTDVFTEFIIQTTRLVDHYALSAPREETDEFVYHEESQSTAFEAILSETDFYYEGRQLPYTLIAPDYVGIRTYWYRDRGMRIPDPIYPHYIESIPGPDGSGVMIPAFITGVRAGGNEEAGLEFVQLLLSRELQMAKDYYYGGYENGLGYPVIWDYTETIIKKKEEHFGQECAVVNDYKETITNLRTVIIDEYLFEQTLLAAQSCYRVEDRLTPEQAAEDLYEATRIYLAELR